VDENGNRVLLAELDRLNMRSSSLIKQRSMQGRSHPRSAPVSRRRVGGSCGQRCSGSLATVKWRVPLSAKQQPLYDSNTSESVAVRRPWWGTEDVREREGYRRVTGRNNGGGEVAARTWAGSSKRSRNAPSAGAIRSSSAAAPCRQPRARGEGAAAARGRARAQRPLPRLFGRTWLFERVRVADLSATTRVAPVVLRRVLPPDVGRGRPASPEAGRERPRDRALPCAAPPDLGRRAARRRSGEAEALCRGRSLMPSHSSTTCAGCAAISG